MFLFIISMLSLFSKYAHLKYSILPETTTGLTDEAVGCAGPAAAIAADVTSCPICLPKMALFLLFAFLCLPMLKNAELNLFFKLGLRNFNCDSGSWCDPGCNNAVEYALSARVSEPCKFV